MQATCSVLCAAAAASPAVDAAHHVAAVPGGSVMRSRFWLGKPYLAARTTPVRAVLPIAKRLVSLTELDARALLVHCSQEMTHLAAFLPALHEQEA